MWSKVKCNPPAEASVTGEIGGEHLPSVSPLKFFWMHQMLFASLHVSRTHAPDVYVQWWDGDAWSAERHQLYLASIALLPLWI